MEDKFSNPRTKPQKRPKTHVTYKIPKRHEFPLCVIFPSMRGACALPKTTHLLSTPMTNRVVKHPQNDPFPAKPKGAHGGKKQAQSKDKKKCPMSQQHGAKQSNQAITFLILHCSSALSPIFFQYRPSAFRCRSNPISCNRSAKNRSLAVCSLFSAHHFW